MSLFSVCWTLARWRKWGARYICKTLCQERHSHGKCLLHKYSFFSYFLMHVSLTHCIYISQLQRWALYFVNLLALSCLKCLTYKFSVACITESRGSKNFNHFCQSWADWQQKQHEKICFKLSKALCNIIPFLTLHLCDHYVHYVLNLCFWKWHPYQHGPLVFISHFPHISNPHLGPQASFPVW